MAKSKLILDVDEVQDYAPAMSAALLVKQQNPNQEIGTKGALKTLQGVTEFIVTRNDDSYTVVIGNKDEF